MLRRSVMSVAFGALAGILILASGCMEQDPMAAQLEPSMGVEANVVRAAKQYTSGSYSAIIGTEGGELNFGIGTVVFPEGALSHPTRISAAVDGSTIGVSFNKHIVFPAESQPTLTLSYAGAEVDTEQLRVFHLNDAGEHIETLKPTVRGAEQVASVSVSSFSGFILATAH